jgi:3-ketosteroid 9alpha-monooxygenase subunit A
MATTKDYRLGEFTYPRGWFMISEAKALDTHKPVAVRFFGQDFALYRGRESGRSCCWTLTAPI